MDTTVETFGKPVAPAVTARRYGIAFYLAGTFLFSWLLLAVSVLAAATHVSPPLPDAAIITLATLGPILGAIGVSAYESGRVGVRALLGSMVRWRVAPAWYARALLGPGLATLAGFAIWLALGGTLPPAPPLMAWMGVPILIVALLVPALCEEAGWRGYLFPRLQARYGMLPAGLLVGAVHAAWHIPVFLIPSAGFGNLPFAFFALYVVSMGVIMAWLYNGTGGSVLLNGLAHAAFNAWPLPWTAALVALPEGARGLHVQIAIALAMAVWAGAIAFTARRRPATATQLEGSKI
ncbi:MAG: CPBP family intramembrane glutamic endopeptidase [Chloroflexia bacterium]